MMDNFSFSLSQHLKCSLYCTQMCRDLPQKWRYTFIIAAWGSPHPVKKLGMFLLSSGSLGVVSKHAPRAQCFRKVHGLHTAQYVWISQRNKVPGASWRSALELHSLPAQLLQGCDTGREHRPPGDPAAAVRPQPRTSEGAWGHREVGGILHAVYRPTLPVSTYRQHVLC